MDISESLALRRSRDCPSVELARFLHPIMLLRSADKRIVNKMKVYIERNNLQQELIRYRNFFDFIHVYCKAPNSMQYCPPNAHQDVSER